MALYGLGLIETLVKRWLASCMALYGLGRIETLVKSFHVLGVADFAVVHPGGSAMFQFAFTSSVLEL